jgi:predicted DNA-binding transcriptional regulator AlpA
MAKKKAKAKTQARLRLNLNPPVQQETADIAADRFYRRVEVIRNRYFGVGNTALEELIKKGTISPPVKLGHRIVGWFGRDLIENQRRLQQEAA